MTDAFTRALRLSAAIRDALEGVKITPQSTPFTEAILRKPANDESPPPPTAA